MTFNSIIGDFIIWVRRVWIILLRGLRTADLWPVVGRVLLCGGGRDLLPLRYYAVRCESTSSGDVQGSVIIVTEAAQEVYIYLKEDERTQLFCEDGYTP